MSNHKKVKEPLFHIVKRDTLNWWEPWVVRGIAIALSLVIAGVLTFLLTGVDPITLYTEMIDCNFGTDRSIWKLLQGMAMLLCIALAVTPAFKMKFWNIGAEGQVLMGALATGTCMLHLTGKVPTFMLFIIMILAAVISGAIWAVVPAIFRAKWGTNETLFTLMMNYVAIQILNYFSSVWANPVGSGSIGVINLDTEIGWLPVIGENEYLLNVIIVAVITVAMFIYLKYSKQGYEISVVGESKNTAKYIGINVKKVIIRTMLISGAICGIAGFLLVSGTNHTMNSDTAAGRGFTAIIVSWLAKFNPFYMVLSSFLVVFLQNAARNLSQIGLDIAFADILTGIIFFFIIGSEFFINYSLKFRKKEVSDNV